MYKMTVAGKLSSDPEFKTTTAGKEMAQFNMNVPNFYKKDSEGKPSPRWVKVMVFGNLKVVCNYLSKGMGVAVTGNADISAYINKTTNEPTVSVTIMADEITSLTGAVERNESKPARSQSRQSQSSDEPYDPWGPEA